LNKVTMPHERWPGYIDSLVVFMPDDLAAVPRLPGSRPDLPAIARKVVNEDDYA
jgi:hypothetical protein